MQGPARHQAPGLCRHEDRHAGHGLPQARGVLVVAHSGALLGLLGRAGAPGLGGIERIEFLLDRAPLALALQAGAIRGLVLLRQMVALTRHCPFKRREAPYPIHPYAIELAKLIPHFLIMGLGAMVWYNQNSGDTQQSFATALAQFRADGVTTIVPMMDWTSALQLSNAAQANGFNSAPKPSRLEKRCADSHG